MSCRLALGGVGHEEPSDRHEAGHGKEPGVSPRDLRADEAHKQAERDAEEKQCGSASQVHGVC